MRERDGEGGRKKVRERVREGRGNKGNLEIGNLINKAFLIRGR